MEFIEKLQAVRVSDDYVPKVGITIKRCGELIDQNSDADVAADVAASILSPSVDAATETPTGRW